jgi:two-component system, NarL family, response regulator NreC
MEKEKFSPSHNKQHIRIIVADDHQIVRQGLRMLLESEPDMEVIAEATTGREASRLAQELLPDVIVMDVSMPELNGIEATRQILSLSPGVKVISLSMHADILSVLNMFRSGASGYLLKECAMKELVEAIRTISRREFYLSPELLGIVAKEIKNGRQNITSSVFSVLTAREREVLQLVAEGKTTNQIAEYLYVSVKTVEAHRKKVMDKLALRSIAELTKYAVRQGLTSLQLKLGAES